jgi:hypothetical protein
MDDGTRAFVAQQQAEARMDAQRCRHTSLHETDGVDGWYRCGCSRPGCTCPCCRGCGDFMEFPTLMKAHTPNDLRAMIHWFQEELARRPGAAPVPPAALAAPEEPATPTTWSAGEWQADGSFLPPGERVMVEPDLSELSPDSSGLSALTVEGQE